MPSILVVPDTEEDNVPAFTLKERVTARPLLDSAHFSSQLIERLAWAIEDAEQAERQRAAP